MTPTAPLAADRVAQLGALGRYIGPDDNLRIASFNAAAGVTLAIEARILLEDGSVVACANPHVPNTDRSVATALVKLQAGWLLGVLVRATAGTPRIGQCFVVLEIVRGFTGAVVPVDFLAEGYVTDTTRFGWPGSPSAPSGAGPGVIRSITGTDPAAGAEVSETVPANARWRLIGFRVTLVTDATVANRNPQLVLDDGTTVFWGGSAIAAQAASLTNQFNWGEGSALPIFATNAVPGMALPVQNRLMGGFRIRTITAAIAGGDNYGAPQLLVEEWIED